MSAPYVDSTSWVPLAVFLASLAGSFHCATMCSGLVVATVNTRSAWAEYQLGRLVGYLGLGAGAGYLGGKTLGAGVEWLSFVSATLLSAGLVLAAAQIWRGRPLHLAILPQGLLLRVFRLAQGKAWETGLLSALLPCGWLHTFVLGAVATRSALSGAGFLLVFWLGTLPALAASPWILRRGFGTLLSKVPRVAATLLLVAGALSIGTKVMPLLAGGSAPPACHH